MTTSPDHIVAAAETVLDGVPAYVWDGERLPVPVEEIVDTCYGLYVRDVKDMATAPGAPALAPGQSLSGLLLPASGEIWVNADEARQWPPRRRFTAIGHELGHWVMHRRPAAVASLRRTSRRRERARARVVSDIEEEASAFAAELADATLAAPYRGARPRQGRRRQALPVFDSSNAAIWNAASRPSSALDRARLRRASYPVPRGRRLIQLLGVSASMSEPPSDPS